MEVLTTPTMTTRSKAKMVIPGAASPFVYGSEDPAGKLDTPRPRRAAVAQGTPLSSARPALEDLTNESPIVGFMADFHVVKGARGARTAKGAAVNRKGTPRPAAKGAIPGRTVPQGPRAQSAECAEVESGEDALRRQVCNMIAGTPDPSILETPVLTKKRLPLQKTPARSRDGVPEQGAEAVGGVLLEEEAAMSNLCFSPTTFLAPTPNNTPNGPMPTQQPRLNAEAVSASLSRFAETRPTPKSPAGSQAGKPPSLRPARGTPRRATTGVIPTLHIATPIGKTPPLSGKSTTAASISRRRTLSGATATFDPAHLLHAIAAVPLQAEDSDSSPASSPERPSRALTFDSPPTAVNRSLPSTPAIGPKYRRCASAPVPDEGTGDFPSAPALLAPLPAHASASSVPLPASPAWSLDVNLSTPAGQKLAQGIPQALRSELEFWAEEEEDYAEGEEVVDAESPQEDEEDEDSDEGVCMELSSLSVNGRSVALRGLPEPAGTHIYFQD